MLKSIFTRVARAIFGTESIPGIMLWWKWLLWPEDTRFILQEAIKEQETDLQCLIRKMEKVTGYCFSQQWADMPEMPEHMKQSSSWRNVKFMIERMSINSTLMTCCMVVLEGNQEAIVEFIKIGAISHVELRDPQADARR